MEEIKPKKERKFLKAMGEVALTLVRDLLLNVGKKVINKSGNKRQGLVLAFIILASTFAIAQFPNTGNKQRLGFQTTADGLVWRGSISDTASIQPINNQNAWVILDTVNLKMYSFDFTSNVWNLVGISGGGGLTMPFDSITFNTAKNGTVGVGEVEYNDTQGSLIQGLKGGNVTNVIGQQLHQRVNNRTGAPLAKGDVVYLAGSQGNRITVAKGLAVTDAFSANTFGVVAESIADNASGFIITEGLITGLNTSALTEDSAVYLSPTVPGALTSTKPQAPQHSVYIGVCVKSNNGSGELFIKIRNGQELDELHDTRITNPVTGATLYYSGGLWRDTTAALLVSDTASMLTNYLRTGTAASTYLTQSNAASTYLPLTGGTLTGTINRQEGSHNGSTSTFYYNILNYFARQDNIKYNPTAQITFTDRPGTLTFPNNVRTSDIYLMTAKNWNGTSLGQYLDTTLSVVANQDGGRIGISKLNPNYKLDVNGTFNASGNSLIGGTLGVTGNTAIGVTTASNKFHVNSENNGTGGLNWIAGNFGGLSGDRVVMGILNGKATIGGHNNALNAWADLILNQDGGNIGINTATPSFKLDVNGTLGVTGATTLSNLAGTGSRMVVAGSGGLLSTQAIPTGTVTSVGGTGSVNGITLSGTVTSSGNLTLGGTLSGVSLSSQVTGTLPIGNGGTGATTAATARTALGATVRGANTFILPDISAISFLRYNADNTVSQRGADGMRSDLGGTTIGQSMFTLTNPSAIRFPQFNTDNTVSALDAASFRTAIGAGTGNGNGTVTNVTGTLPISVANGTTTPSITIANASTTASGVVTTGTQSMAGNKTFTGDLATSGAFSATGFSTLTGGASIGTMATTSSLTHVLGVNSSNAIGEIGVADGIKFTSGSLGLDSYKTIALMDFPSTNAQSSSDITATVTGAVAGTPVLLGVPNAAVLANTSYSAWVSSTNTVTVRFNNYSSAAANPAQGSFYLIVLNL